MPHTDQTKAVEQALRESLARLEIEFNQAPVGISEVDPRTGILLRVNNRYCEITGFAREELVGRQFVDFTHPDDRARNLEQYARLLSGEIPSYRIEKRIIRGDGTPIWLDVSALIARDESG